ncbi:hypothetical protein Tco_1445788 [Tanacetum coccineum]
MEKVDSNTTPDLSDMCNNEFEDDQNADDHEDERVVLANLIANLKLDIDENKMIQKQLRKANATLTHEPNECRSALAESNDIRDRCRTCEKRMDNAWQQLTIQEITVLVINLLISLAIKFKDDAFKFENALKKEMFEDLEYVQSLEKEIDELQSDKNEFSKEYDLLLQECIRKDILYVSLTSMVNSDNYCDMACKYLDKIKESNYVALEFKNQALQSGQHGLVLQDVDEIETINIELEHSVAKLLHENENLHIENEHLKQTYKDLYDSIKLTRDQTKVKNDSLIEQFNKTYVENANLKAQLQDKTIANTEMRESWNKIKVRQYDFAKPDHVNALVLSKNISKGVSFLSPKEYVGSNDMVHNYYLKEAKKKAQIQVDEPLNTKPSVQ